MEIWFAFRCAGGAGGIDSLPSPAQHHHRSDGFARLRVVLRGSEFPDPHGKNAGATGSDCFRIPAAGFLYSDPRRQSTYFRTHQQFGILLDFISDSRIISRAECDRHGPTPRHGPDFVAQIFGPYFTTKKFRPWTRIIPCSGYHVFPQCGSGANPDPGVGSQSCFPGRCRPNQVWIKLGYPE